MCPFLGLHRLTRLYNAYYVCSVVGAVPVLQYIYIYISYIYRESTWKKNALHIIYILGTSNITKSADEFILFVCGVIYDSYLYFDCRVLTSEFFGIFLLLQYLVSQYLLLLLLLLV